MLYTIAKNLLYLIINSLYQVEVTGLNNVPDKGAAIVCSNHVSFVDPIAIAVFVKRKLHFMAKKEIFINRPVNYLLKCIGCIPVDRANVGMSSFKESMKVLNAGKVMGIFAQSTRRKSVDEKDAKAGVALFAYKSGAKVVPVGLKGSFKPLSVVKVNIGEPIDFSQYKNEKLRSPELNSLTEEIMKRVKTLAGE